MKLKDNELYIHFLQQEVVDLCLDATEPEVNWLHKVKKNEEGDNADTKTRRE